MLAKSLPPRSNPETSSPPSPQSTPEKPAIAPAWQPQLLHQNLVWQQSFALVSPTPSPATEANSSISKTSAQEDKAKPTQGNNAPGKAQKSARAQPPAPQPPENLPLIEMRVAIARDVSSLSIATSTTGKVVDAQGKVIEDLPPNQGRNVLPSGANLRFGELQTPQGVWVKPTEGGLVYVNGNWYRGDLLLVSLGDTLLAVNYVDLETYIAGVVGSEVYPSWPAAALKAQAIAARSYALVHYFRPANDLYDLGNTQRWQVYKGVSGEWNTTTQAVKETAGLFLSYQGGVVESMYAASEEIVTEVFGGRGMSQTGARDLAQQGYSYQEILGTYYPGAGLSWFDTEQVDTN
jgi:hypothetical protein